MGTNFSPLKQFNPKTDLATGYFGAHNGEGSPERGCFFAKKGMV